MSRKDEIIKILKDKASAINAKYSESNIVEMNYKAKFSKFMADNYEYIYELSTLIEIEKFAWFDGAGDTVEFRTNKVES